MHRRHLGLFGILFSLVFILAACTASGQTTPGTSNAQGTPASSTNAGSFGTPTGQSISSPTASPSAGTQATNLATAFSNLQKQDSYTMTAKLVNVRGSFAAFTGDLPEATIQVNRNGSNRHLQIMNGSDTVFQAWMVNDQVYVDFGKGPTKLSSNNALIQQISGMISADQSIVDSFASRDAQYQVVGTEQVNGQATKVETATYQFGSNPDNHLFLGNMTGMITAKIWVSEDANYLVKADFVFSGSASASSTPTVSGSPIASLANGTQTASANGEVTISVTNVGSTPQIQAPGS